MRNSHPEVNTPASIQVVVEEGVFELRQDVVSDLADIALRNNIGYSEAIQQSIANEAFLMEQEAGGARLIIKPRRGRMRYLERT